MDNRYSPEHSSRSQARNKADRMLKNPAHKEAKELESFILEKRQEYWNGTKSPERDKHDDEGLDVDVSGRVVGGGRRQRVGFALLAWRPLDRT
eukprot:CAMPEP_0171824598 /NCGR_PEP_ID=MMETSP0992-20121227/5074_1 /TAXON_ID=483369 /ORGANISM="non described non described, Strain CCMP2098" /LENGTH=92 /DNA_ID=CAMNT_0012439443 /DNA_START=186 /DNA_END=460 /DNA_ORIENTATION=-